MNKEVAPEIIEDTKQCRWDFQCLNEHGKPICPVVEVIAEDVLFIKCPGGIICNYIMPHGDRNICLCPIRKELYRKYKM